MCCPLFSVVIPMYNVGNYVSDTIQSVLNQTCQDFEIIIVDDGSTDNSANKVKEFVDSRIRYIYQNNAGVSVSRNTGIANAVGKYVALLDADDYWHLQHLEFARKAFEQHPEIKWYAAKYEITSKLYNDRGEWAKFEECDFKTTNYFTEGYRNVWSSCVVYLRDSLRKFKFKEGLSLGEDLLFWYQYASNNSIVCLNHFVTAYYLQHNDSAVHNYKIFKNYLSKDFLDIPVRVRSKDNLCLQKVFYIDGCTLLENNMHLDFVKFFVQIFPYMRKYSIVVFFCSCLLMVLGKRFSLHFMYKSLNRY